MGSKECRILPRQLLLLHPSAHSVAVAGFVVDSFTDILTLYPTLTQTHAHTHTHVKCLYVQERLCSNA